MTRFSDLRPETCLWSRSCLSFNLPEWVEAALREARYTPQMQAPPAAWQLAIQRPLSAAFDETRR